MRCLEKDDADKVQAELYDESTGRHFGGETTADKVLRVGYYWITLFKYAHAYARTCQVFQVNAGKERIPAFPSHLVIVENLFEQWGLDIVGEINPNYSKLHKYILTTTDYFTRWTEAIYLKIVNDNEVIQFLQRNTITRYGVPNSFFITLHISLL